MADAPLAPLLTMTEHDLMLVTVSPGTMTEEEGMLVAEIAALRAALAERPASLSTPQMAAIATALKEECEKQHARAERAEAQVQAARRSALEEARNATGGVVHQQEKDGNASFYSAVRACGRAIDALRASPGESEEPT